MDGQLVAGSLSAIGSERHCDGQGAVPNHPAQTAQDWRTGARHRTQSLGIVLQRLPGPGAVRPCLSATPLLAPAAVQLFDKSFAMLSIIPRSSASACPLCWLLCHLVHDFVPQPLYRQHCRPPREKVRLDLLDTGGGRPERRARAKARASSGGELIFASIPLLVRTSIKLTSRR
jgi:hypothetical protein